LLVDIAALAAEPARDVYAAPAGFDGETDHTAGIAVIQQDFQGRATGLVARGCLNFR